MVRFSCFVGQIHSHKPKKSVQPLVNAVQKTFDGYSPTKASTNSSNSKSLNSFLVKSGDSQIHDTPKPSSSMCVERGYKSEEIEGELSLDGEIVSAEARHFKKSMSLGSELYMEGRAHSVNDTNDATDQRFSCESYDQTSLVEMGKTKDQGTGMASHYKNVHFSESVKVGSDQGSDASIDSVGKSQPCANLSNHSSDSPLSGEHRDGSANYTPYAPTPIVRSSSTPIFTDSLPTNEEHYPTKFSASPARSFDDHQDLDIRRGKNPLNEYDTTSRQEQEEDDSFCKPDKTCHGKIMEDVYDSCDYYNSAKDWIVPFTDETNNEKIHQGETSGQKSEESAGKDFKMKRIEEWVNDLQHCCPLEEADPLDYNDQVERESPILNGSTVNKVDPKQNIGMEAAKKYISSLSASASTAQLTNHGLVVIPFLSAFVSLRVLNLSGNAIVRITAGALPRGLHTLNLSKNNISTIEGLRELTRLRALDLSYNRIFRIGRGLGSCSSLKELYLAGNKITEVEGLHRLLKLTVLDLRFNKLSTTKCLAQLAANYNSLQAISLEGNPAQKNIGDEQLKKYLQGLLPSMLYFNRQPTKTSTLKDAADRSVRLGISVTQNERGLRSELKPNRKSSHGVHAHRVTSSSATHGSKHHQDVGSAKLSKSRHGKLPPIGIKSKNGHHHPNGSGLDRNLPNFRPEHSLRRIQSEGALGSQ